jgi:tRNA-splicing ligase RtcB
MNERIRMWTEGVAVDAKALDQIARVASMPFVFPHVAVMPDVHVGIGATVGSVIPTVGAVIPAAVGVDIGCGMMATRTTLTASDLPESLAAMRLAIEKAVPHGFSMNRGPRHVGDWGDIPDEVAQRWVALLPGYRQISAKHPRLGHGNDVNQLGTLGTGNHFVEVCLDQAQSVWFVLHSGSRGVGNRIGRFFIELAKEDMLSLDAHLPDKDLSYLREGTEHFDEYVEAVEWAQRYASANRELMMQAVIRAVASVSGIPPFQVNLEAVNCHHNYVSREHHFGRDVLVTRKGAVSARDGEMGIIPGSMGAKTFIVRGRGNADSLHSCSHGAGRAYSRTAARKTFTLADHVTATEGVECRKDDGVLDETPAAYKPIDAVMAAQKDLVEIIHQLKQIVCVKG